MSTTIICSCIILLLLSAYGCFTVYDTTKSFDKTTESTSEYADTTDTNKSVTTDIYKYRPLNISDGRLAYYGLKNSELLKEKHISQKPVIETDEKGKITSLTMLIDNTSNAVLQNDTEQSDNKQAFTIRYITSKAFLENQDAIFVTNYAYNTIFKPCKQIITDYVQTTNEPVLYRVILEYDNTSSEQQCPKWINIRACTKNDNGKTFDFSLYILNCDKDKIADRSTLDWDITITSTKKD